MLHRFTATLPKSSQIAFNMRLNVHEYWVRLVNIDAKKKPDSRSILSISHFDQLNYENAVCRCIAKCWQIKTAAIWWHTHTKHNLHRPLQKVEKNLIASIQIARFIRMTHASGDLLYNYKLTSFVIRCLCAAQSVICRLPIIHKNGVQNEFFAHSLIIKRSAP